MDEAAVHRLWHGGCYLIAAADGGPGVGADAGAEFLQAEPGAGLAGADLEGYALA